MECENCGSEKKVAFRKPVGKHLCLKCWNADISERARKRYWEGEKTKKELSVEEFVKKFISEK